MASIYSWESFIRIHGGEPGARNVFEKVMDDLLRAENPDKEVHIVKASRGDGGIDVYVHQEDGIDIYQCKFFMGTLDSSQWSQIKESFSKAMEPKGVTILRWCLCMPREMQKEDMKKWDAYKDEKEKKFSGVKLRYIDGNEIISRMEDCDRKKGTALIDKYFHENQEKHFTNKELIIPFTMSKANSAQGGTYVPRDDLLAKIEESFKTERIVFLSGMGGCGKSELARAYGHKHRDDYEEIFWLTCDDGVAPDLMGLMEKAQYKIKKSDLRWFSHKVLIIIDNCNLEDGEFLSVLENGVHEAHILVTTRLLSMGRFKSISVESDEPEQFAYTVFEQNYCLDPELGEKQKVILSDEIAAVHEICREVLYNTMFVSLIGIRLREYNDLSITDCAKRVGNGISRIRWEIDYGKDQNNKSGDIKEILSELFKDDVLKYNYSTAQKRVIALLSLTPAKWYDVSYICELLDGVKLDTHYRRAIKLLLKFGWLQGNMERIAIHPLISEVLSEHPGLGHESTFFENLLENYLGLADKYFRKESFLINKVLKRAEEATPEKRLAVMILLNHGGYRCFFAELYPEVAAAYFVYVEHDGKRYFMYRDLSRNWTRKLVEVPCQEEGGSGAKLLKVYDTGKPYTLDLNKQFMGEEIKTIPEGLCWCNINIQKCIWPMTLNLIGSDAFNGCSSLSGELRFPESLTSIGDGAFNGCSGLSGELRFPESLTSIGDGAFNGCSGFNGALRLPESLTSIGDYVFDGCRGLSGELRFPKSLASIGEQAFFGCSGLSGELRFPESLTNIGDGAFWGCSGLSGELHLPESLTNIGYNVFVDCSGLSGELHLPERLSLGDIAIPLCTSWCLRDVGIIDPYSIQEISYSLNGDSYNSYVVEIRTNKELPDPERVRYISEWAFSRCSELSGEVHISESVTRIGLSAFKGCDKIEKLIFHNPNTEIEDFLPPYSDTVIVGYSHSTAESYARENGLVFEELEEEG